MTPAAAATPTAPVEVKVPTLLAPHLDPEAVAVRNEAVALIGSAAKLSVTNETSAQRATEIGVAIQRCRKALDAMHDRFKAPALQYGKEVDALYLPQVKRCDEAKRRLGERLSQWQESERKAAEEKRRAEEAEAKRLADEAAKAAADAAAVATETGDVNADLDAERARLDAEDKAKQAQEIAAAPAPVVPTAPLRAASGGGASIRMEWTFEVTDAAKVPREYLIVDERAIAAMVKAKKGQIEIAGVRVFQKPASSWR